MPPVISFIGWHNSGKTTLASQVVAQLKDRGYSVAVIKSTKDIGIETDQPHTDTAIYRQIGADSVALLAPDQLIIRGKPPEISLLGLAHRYFFDMDIVIAEGFKHAAHVPKIEVRRGMDGPLLSDEVDGVVAIASDWPHADTTCFRLDQIREIADFIEARLLSNRQSPVVEIALTVNGACMSLPESIRSQLAAIVGGLLAPLHSSLPPGTLELNLRCQLPPADAP